MTSMNVFRRSTSRLAACVSLALLTTVAAGCSRYHTVAGHSMEPAFPDGTRVRIALDARPLRRGDVVLFYWPKDQTKTFIQRIVGLPGETLTVIMGRVVIDGRPIDEPYVAFENRSMDMLPATKVPAGQYFMMGDNRQNASDSRAWGPVPDASIWATVVGK
jgi:signal peptidase I